MKPDVRREYAAVEGTEAYEAVRRSLNFPITKMFAAWVCSLDRRYWSAIQNDDWIDATEALHIILKEPVQNGQSIKNLQLKRFFSCRSCYYF